MSKSMLRRLVVFLPVLSVALAGLLGVSSPARAEDKPEVCEFDCGIGEKSNFSLNDAQVVGGGAKVDGDIPGTTYTYSPDGKFRLVQGERMYVEYVDKDSITDYSGNAQNIPGSITLRWPKAAFEAKTGELLDVELTLSDISLRVADYTNEYTYDYDLEHLVDRFPLVFMYNTRCNPKDINPGCGSLNYDIRESLARHRSSLVANAALINPGYGDSTLDLVDSTSHLTYRFFKQDGEESDQVGTASIGDFMKPGMVGGIGSWSPNWDQVDPMQPHVKIFSGNGCLRQPDRKIGPWLFDPGVKFGEERPCKQAWSQADHSEKVGAPYVEMSMKSGLTIELSNKEPTGIVFSNRSCFSHVPAELRISKVGEGASVFTGEDSNGHNVTKAINGSTVDFIYKVENIGQSPVWDIEVTDSKGVKVTCPKTVLVGGESMTCTGTGVVRAEPGK